MTYLCGPMTGIQDDNYPAFRVAAKALRANGYRILSPHEENPGNDQPWEYYLHKALILLLQRCDSLALLPGWENSKGAQLELSVASALGYMIYDVVDGRLVPR